MNTSQLPTKLQHDPIVDCIIELRFKTASDSVVDVFPGVLYSFIKESFPNMRNTPVAEIPPKVRRVDENLRYQATVEFHGDWGRVLVADSSVQLRINYPYPGWAEVEPRALDVLKSVVDTGLISEYERISIVYHNVIEASENPNDLSPLELKLDIGRSLESPPQGTLLRTEIPHDAGVTIVQIQSGAVAQITTPSKSVKELRGIHLSVDTIAVRKMQSFEEMKTNLSLVHGIEREIFFNMVKEDTWKKMGPIWE